MYKFILVLAIIVWNSGCHSSTEEKLIIACASNARYAIEEITDEFEKEHDIETELIVSASGILYSQILNGAPFDIFISADMTYPDKLYESGFNSNKVLEYAQGNLVFWSLHHSDISLDQLTQMNHIAIANPEIAPYGVAAKEVLERLELFDLLKGKLVYGESISQINQFILSGSADAGFTAKAVILSESMNDKGSWVEVPLSYYSPIRQGAIQLNDKPAGRAFIEIMMSNNGREVLNKFGYFTNDEPIQRDN